MIRQRKRKLNCFERSALKILKRVVSVWFGNTEMRLETLLVMKKNAVSELWHGKVLVNSVNAPSEILR